MFIKAKSTQQKALDSADLEDAYTDFILSRQAALVSQNTILYYKFTAGLFIRWLGDQGITTPDEVQVRHVREYLAQLAAKGKSDRTIADHARAIQTLVRFWHTENYLSAPVVFQIPKIAKKRLLTFDAETLKKVLAVCDTKQRAIVMFMVDSGLRRSEVCNLCWSDIDMGSGQVIVLRGKGGKARATKIGANTRRALLKYRRTLKHPLNVQSPVFQTKSGTKYTGKGLREVFVAISKKSGFQVTAHSLRRTFAILSLRAGMSPLHLKGLGGWEGIAMVEHYAQLVDDDLMHAHQEHSPIDNLDRLK